jgi:hypothetical protein
MRWGRLSGDTDTDTQQLVYAMESKDATNLVGKTITLSWYARRGVDLSNDMSVYMTAGEGKDQSVIAGWTNDQVFSAQNDTLTTSFVRYSYTITVPQDKAQLRIIFGYSPSGTAGANEYIDISAVQLEVGNTATFFKRAGDTIEDELANCQRYYEKSYEPQYAPGTINGNGISRESANSSGIFRHAQNMVDKRAIPSIALYNHATGALGQMYIGGGSYAITAVTNGFSIFSVEASGAPANGDGMYHWTADAEL